MGTCLEGDKGRKEVGLCMAHLMTKNALLDITRKRVRGLEPLTSTLGRLRSTTELYPQIKAKL